MKKYIYLLVIAFLFTGCKEDEYEHEHNKTFTIIIASEKFFDPQGVEGAMVGYWVKYQMDEKWVSFSYAILDFNYEEGYEYVLKIQQKHTEYDRSLIADIKCCRCQLLEVIYKVKKDSEGLEKD